MPEISRKVLAQVAGEYDFKQEISASSDALLGVEQQVQTKGIISLDQMADIVNESKNNNIIKLCGESRFAKYIKDEELRFIDQLLDNEIINRLLAYEGYSPAMRDLFPHNLFRAELLKTIKYPEISYRKFCDEEYLGLDRKQNRAFIGLSLREKIMIDHTQLSKFRHSLTYVQQINITVYILHHFLQSGMLGDHILHGVDSTELANECKIPLASLNINGQNIRIYSDLDSDCGKRRNKRDKSVYVVGYRLHTLTAIDAETGHSFPIISL
ncbi:MAG: transposase, partial [Candidatus Electrothrix sp. AW2]|nr:transposase [Candidatus Electrothrix gigas]